jgi:hypothetical protein
MANSVFLTDGDMKRAMEGEHIEMSVTEARAFIDVIDDDDLASAFDSAQGDVFSGNKRENYVVIRIVP